MSFYYESEDLNEIRDPPFLCLNADEAENTSHNKCFVMFIP